jgi:nucleotide-binding universal stress UspA family protein
MIPKIKKVLYATDLGDNAMYAFRYAVNTMEKHNAEMIILHVIEPMPSAIRAYFTGDNEKWTNVKAKSGELTNDIRRRIEEFCKEELREREKCLERIKKIEIIEGYPADQILKTAEDQNCDVIIMGSHGKGVLTYTFLGSVSERVLRRTKKPVFIIPLPEKGDD